VVYNEKIRTKDKLIEIQFSLRPVFGGNGEVEYLVAEGQDITELKDAQEKLQKAYDLINAMRSLAGILDKDGRVEFINATVAKDLGFGEAEIIGKYFWEVGWIAKEYEEKVRKAIMTASKGEALKVEMEACSKDKRLSFPVFPFSWGFSYKHDF
jgi:PAS domain-containing protein